MTPLLCPLCGTDRVCRILRGPPTPEDWQLVHRYQAVLGSSDDPNDWFCAECFHEWRDAAHPGGDQGT